MLKTWWDMISPPEIISSFGHVIDDLFYYITIVDLIYFILVCAGLFGFSFLYSKKRHPKALYTHGTGKKEIIVTTLIGAIVFFSLDLVITYRANNDLINHIWKWPDEDKEEVVRVQVLAQQWMWAFRLPGRDGKFNTIDDIVTNHELHIPKGKKVVAQITSKDVIHSFYIPNARIKVDAIPGRVTRLWFDANKSGTFNIACAEMCGTSHYAMKAYLKVHETASDYQAWLDEEHPLAIAQTSEDFKDKYWGWTWE